MGRPVSDTLLLMRLEMWFSLTQLEVYTKVSRLVLRVLQSDWEGKPPRFDNPDAISGILLRRYRFAVLELDDLIVICLNESKKEENMLAVLLCWK